MKKLKGKRAIFAVMMTTFVIVATIAGHFFLMYDRAEYWNVMRRFVETTGIDVLKWELAHSELIQTVNRIVIGLWILLVLVVLVLQPWKQAPKATAALSVTALVMGDLFRAWLLS